MPIDLSSWLNQVSADKPPDSVIAFNVGMFRTSDGFGVYLGGFDAYDENDSDWACEPVFVPSSKYFFIRDNNIGWEEAQSEVISSVQNFLASENGKKSYLAQAEHLTAGFDDGGLVEIN